jgi:hypothetical protein
MQIFVTERGDAGLDLSWKNKPGPFILITKRPSTFLTTELPDNAILHCTITGHGGTKLEPGVNKPEIELDAYNRLCDLYGAAKIVLRVDPIIPTSKGIAIANSILAHSRGRTRISFIDAYPHVRARFKQACLPDLPWDGLHAPLNTRRDVLCSLHAPYRPEVCGEPGLACEGCVSKLDLYVLKIYGGTRGGKQRADCQCLAEKTEALSNRGQCKHGCLYCYWK